jgi:putative DNA primase/helicase
MHAVLLPQWLGGGRKGHEWLGERRANGGLGDSWAVNLNTGNWLHGAGDESGLDLVSLYAALNHLEPLAALKDVAAQVGIVEGRTASVLPREAAAKPPESKPEPIPADAPPIPDHPHHGAATASYRYGRAFVVARYDKGGKKEFRPFTWRSGKWAAKGYPEPRPLYHLNQIAENPAAPVLIVEGEKCADIAAVTLRKYVCLTWSNGTNSVQKNDWKPLAARDVIIWPDADEPGRKAAAWLAAHLSSICERVRVVDPKDKPEGWDIADAVKEGMDSKAIAKWAGENIVTIPKPAPPAAVAPIDEPPRSPDMDSLPVAAEPDFSPPEDIDPSAFVAWDSLGLDTNQGGLPHNTIANASRIIQMHPAMAGKIWYDAFRDKIYTSLGGAGTARAWTDGDDLNVAVFIQQQMKLNKFNLALVQSAVVHAARVNQRNSLTDWLDSLKWDGEPRLDMWLFDTLGVENNEYTQAVSINWPISMVARAYRPGCQVDTMPVLEGYQGRGKSTFLEILGGPWYKSLSMGFGDKDFLQAMQGAWLIEIPDMTGFGRREHSQVISTITIRTDEYRKSYGRHSESHPRACVFAATSETDDYLGDTRGRRRYWPLRCKDISLDVLRANREQLFAEAVVRYRNGATWYEMPAQADQEQLDRASEDIWTERMMIYVEHCVENHITVTSSRILSDAIDMKLSQQGDGDKRRVARIMRDNGWSQVRDARGRRWRKIER